MSDPMADALVLAGAVVKGAFTAGALSVLSEPAVKKRLGLDVRRIVGASSGALNGAYYAAAIRSGEEAGAGARLARIWIEEATALGAFDVDLPALVAREGLSDQKKLVALLRRHIRPSIGREPIELRLVVTNADGDLGRIDGEVATTFERIVDFAGADFDAAGALERVFVTTAASAAFPGAYAPVALPKEGGTVQALDGGIIDNAPLSLALQGAPEIGRVILIVPFPRVLAAPVALHGLALVSHVFDMLVQERLFRDLRELDRVNRALHELEARVPDRSHRAALLETLGWSGRRPAHVIEIRPPDPLPGDAFSGFWSRELREQYVQAGIDAARAAVALVERHGPARRGRG